MSFNYLQYKQNVYSPRFIVKQYDNYSGRIIKLKNVRQKGFEEFLKNEEKLEKYIKTDTEELHRISLSRTKMNIREICLCNDFEYFATWTINEKNNDRFHLDKVVEYMKKLLKAYQRKFKDFKYIYIIEKHENGGYHFHGFVKGIPGEELFLYTKEDYTFPKKLPYRLINSIEKGNIIYHIPFFDNKQGFNTFSKIKSKYGASNYIMKYITKNPIRTSENQIYFCSRGLKRANCIEIQPNLDFDFANSYENDYCKIWDYNILNMKHKYLIDLITAFKM